MDKFLFSSFIEENYRHWQRQCQEINWFPLWMWHWDWIIQRKNKILSPTIFVTNIFVTGEIQLFWPIFSRTLPSQNRAYLWGIGLGNWGDEWQEETSTGAGNIICLYLNGGYIYTCTCVKFHLAIHLRSVYMYVICPNKQTNNLRLLASYKLNI